jgi:hypothetical protein
MQVIPPRQVFPMILAPAALVVFTIAFSLSKRFFRQKSV